MMPFLTVDAVVCLVIIILAGIIVYQQISFHKTTVKLVDRMMAKNYGEIIQGEISLKHEVKKSHPEDFIPSEIETLNKFL